MEKNALWRKIIISIHGSIGGLTVGSSSLYKSGSWYHVRRLKDEMFLHGINLPSIFKRKIGNGLSTKFWLDSWIGGPPLCYTFPRLFRLERDTNCVVRDRAPVRDFRNPTDIRPLDLSFNWNWSRPIRSIAEHQEVLELVNLLSSLHLSNDQDTWECTFSDNKCFSVKSMRILITKHIHPLDPQPFRWNKALPLKINISSWRISHNRLPTRFNLDRRGIDLHSTRCPVCDEDIETEEHLFSSCFIAIDTWAKIGKIVDDSRLKKNPIRFSTLERRREGEDDQRMHLWFFKVHLIQEQAATKEKTPKEADALPRVNILDFCEEHYEDIFLVIIDKIRRDKRKEVHTRLDFGESSKKSRRMREGSQNLSVVTLPARYRNPSKRPKMWDRLRSNDGNMFGRLGHRRQSVFERLSDTYSPSTTKSGPDRENSRDHSHSRGRPHRQDSSPSRDRPRSRDRSRGIEESYGNTCSSYRTGARHRYHSRDRDRSR
ncbi:reverse transcriptase domain-containing protein, partial [Tanacetum coccineum]